MGNNVSIRVKFRPSTVEGRAGNVVYVVTKDKVTRQLSTGYEVYPGEWDRKRSNVLPSNDCRLKMVCKCIQQDLARLGKIARDLEKRDSNAHVSEILAEYRRTGDGKSFFGFMEGVIGRLERLNRSGTACNYRCALESFRRFRRGVDVLLENIDCPMIEDYEAYARDRGMAPNSTSFHMRILRAVYNRAVGGDLVWDRKPFRTVFTGTERTRKRAISIKEMRRIRGLDLTGEPHLKFARDVFLFLFFCRGMSFIDAAYLKHSDIHGDVISYRRHKTNQLLHVRVVKELADIIEAYRVEDSPYVLPIMAPGDGAGRKQYSAAIHRINKHLKVIGAMAGLRLPLTTYVSRHAWATIARNKNVPINVISEGLGHDSERTTRIYLASMDMSALDRVNDMIIKSL